MKKLLLTLSVLMGIGTTALGYSWNVTNASNKSLDVELCTTPGIDHCQSATIPAGQSHTFSFTNWYNKGLLLGSVHIQKTGDVTTKQEFSAVNIEAKTRLGVASGGSLTINEDPQKGYSFSN